MCGISHLNCNEVVLKISEFYEYTSINCDLFKIITMN